MNSLYAIYHDNPASRHGIRVIGDYENLSSLLAVLVLSDQFKCIEIRDLDGGLIREWSKEMGFYFKK